MSLSQFPVRRTPELRKGRLSLVGVRYFVTCGVADRSPLLTTPGVAPVVRSVLLRLAADGDVELICATVMPDHVHALLVLGGRLSIGQVVGKLKSLISPTLRSVGGEWQRNFFEHRLRPEDAEDGFARYVFMNPYEAGHIRREESWPHWIAPELQRLAFSTSLQEGKYPPVEWMKLSPEDLGLEPCQVGLD